MKLVAKFTGNTIEGNFESKNVNFELLNKIKEDYYNAKKQFYNQSISEIGIKSDLKKEGFIPASKRYTNIVEIENLAIEKLKSSEFCFSELDNIETYKTKTHKAIITIGKDLGSEFVNNFTTVEIYEI